MTDIRSQIAAHGGLYSISDLAARWGVSRQRVRVIAQHESFPAPVLTNGGQALYLADEADAFRNRKDS